MAACTRTASGVAFRVLGVAPRQSGHWPQHPEGRGEHPRTETIDQDTAGGGILSKAVKGAAEQRHRRVRGASTPCWKPRCSITVQTGLADGVLRHKVDYRAGGVVYPADVLVQSHVAG